MKEVTKRDFNELHKLMAQLKEALKSTKSKPLKIAGATFLFAIASFVKVLEKEVKALPPPSREQK